MAAHHDLDFDSSSFSDFQMPPHAHQKFSLWSKEICQREEQSLHNSPAFLHADSHPKRFFTQQSPQAEVITQRKENISPNFSLAQPDSDSFSMKSKSYISAMRVLQEKHGHLESMNEQLEARLKHISDQSIEREQKLLRQNQQTSCMHQQLRNKIQVLEDKLFKETEYRKIQSQTSKANEDQIVKLFQKQRDSKKDLEKQSIQLSTQNTIFQKQIQLLEQKAIQLQNELLTVKKQNQQLRHDYMSCKQHFEIVVADQEANNLELQRIGKTLKEKERNLRAKANALELIEEELEENKHQNTELRGEMSAIKKDVRRKDKMLTKVEHKLLQYQEHIKTLEKENQELKQNQLNCSRRIFIGSVGPTPSKRGRVLTALQNRRRSNGDGKENNMILKEDRKSMPDKSTSIINNQSLSVCREMIQLEQHSLRLIDTQSRLKKQLADNQMMDHEMRQRLRTKMTQVSNQLVLTSKNLALLKRKESRLEQFVR